MEYIVEISKALIEGMVKTGAEISQAICIDGLPVNVRLSKIMVFKNGNIGALFSDGGISGPVPVRKQIVYQITVTNDNGETTTSDAARAAKNNFVGKS